MDSLETNKAIAAVLLAGIAFSGASLLSNALVKPKLLRESAIKIDLPTSAAGGAEVAGNAPEPPVATLLASADVGRGEAGVKAQGCVACHSFNEGGKAGIGPNLYGVVGGPHGHMGGYPYSAALKSKAGPWTLDELNDWLKKPSAYAPGTKMTYAGLADPKKRADIVLYLRSLSATPVALPAAAAAPAQSAGAKPADTAPAGNEPINVRLAAADPKAGQADTTKFGCVACHSFNEGGKAGIGPNLYGVVGGNVGEHMAGYAYSSALKAHAGTKWTYDELDKWLTKPAAYAPGTKMTYAGITDSKQRADVIDYLRTLAANPEPLPAAE